MKLKTLVCITTLTVVASFATAQQKQPVPAHSGTSSSGSSVDWVQFHFDPALDGYNPYETILSPANVGNVTLKWSYAPSEGFGVSGAPAVVNGRVYFGIAYTGVANSRDPGGPGFQFAVYALDANTGAFLWKYGTDGPIFGSPAVSNGVVYVMDTSSLYALDASTGALIWQYAVNSSQSSPTVVNNVVYIVSADPHSNENIYALNAQTGQFIWAYKTTGAPYPALAVANGVLYSNTSDGSVYALNALTGALVWKKQFGSSISPRPTLNSPYNGQAVANGVLYLGVMRTASSYDVYALNAATGNVLWRRTVGRLYQMNPAVGNGMVYLVSDEIYALNASTGEIVWQSAVGGQSSPILADGVLYTAYLGAPAEGAVYAVIVGVDANTGTLLWQYKTDLGAFNGPEFPTPVVVNGMIYGSLILSGENQVGAWGLPN